MPLIASLYRVQGFIATIILPVRLSLCHSLQGIVTKCVNFTSPWDRQPHHPIVFGQVLRFFWKIGCGWRRNKKYKECLRGMQLRDGNVQGTGEMYLLRPLAAAVYVHVFLVAAALFLGDSCALRLQVFCLQSFLVTKWQRFTSQRYVVTFLRSL